jgi:hypothetical protein
MPSTRAGAELAMCSDVVLALATGAAPAWSRTDAIDPPRVTALTAPRSQDTPGLRHRPVLQRFVISRRTDISYAQRTPR